MVPQRRFHSGEARGVGRCRNRGGKLTRRVHPSGLGGGGQPDGSCPVAAKWVADSSSASGVHLTTGLFAAIVRREAEIAIQRISELLPVKEIDLMDELPAAVQRITIYAAGVSGTRLVISSMPTNSWEQLPGGSHPPRRGN